MYIIGFNWTFTFQYLITFKVYLQKQCVTCSNSSKNAHLHFYHITTKTEIYYNLFFLVHLAAHHLFARFFFFSKSKTPGTSHLQGYAGTDNGQMNILMGQGQKMLRLQISSTCFIGNNTQIYCSSSAMHSAQS